MKTLIDSIPDGTLISIFILFQVGGCNLGHTLSTQCPLDILLSLIQVLDFRQEADSGISSFFDELALCAIAAIVDGGQSNSQYTNRFALTLLLKNHFFNGRPPRALTRPRVDTCSILFAHAKHIIITSPEQANVLDDDTGNLPLHLACQIRNSYGSRLHYRDVIASLMEAYPEGVKIANRDGQLPLHLMINTGKSWDGGICELVRAYPELATIPTPDGFLPLHLMIKARYSWYYGGIHELVKVYPEGVTIPTPDDGLLPLHLMIKAGWTWHDGIHELVKLYPEGLTIPTHDDGMLPLHLLIKTGNEICGLLEAYPDVARIPTRDGLLPFHKVRNAGISASLRGTWAITYRYLEGVSIPIPDGLLPLHLAIKVGRTWHYGICDLVKAYPIGVTIPTPDPEGFLPLHLAIKAGWTWEEIDRLVEAYPKGVTIPTPDGQLPLHLAIKAGWTWHNGIYQLMEAYPQGATIRTHDGLLPLHLMINAGWTWRDGIRELIIRYPLTIFHLNLPPESVPALLSRLDSETMYRVLQNEPFCTQR